MKLLFITEAVPWPTNSGASQRSNLLYKALARHGEVDLILCHRNPVSLGSAEKDFLKSEFRLTEILSPKNAGSFRFGKIMRKLPGKLGGASTLLDDITSDYAPDLQLLEHVASRMRQEHYDGLVVRYVRPALRLGLDRLAGNAFRVIDVDDVPWLVTRAQINSKHQGRKLSTAVLDGLRFWHTRRLIKPRLRSFDHVWVAKESDVSCLPGQKVSVLPNIPFDLEKVATPRPTPAGSSQTLLFVGTIDYPPNWIGLKWFLDEVWPLVRASLPQTKLRIVGGLADKTFAVDWKKWPGVVFEGVLDDLRQVYHDCAATIAPIPWGGGTKIKVLESLAYGRTCVVTSHALAGYEFVLKNGEAVFVADSAPAYAKACIELLGVPETCERLASFGRKVVVKHFTLAVFEQEVGRVISALAAQRRNEQPAVQCSL